MKNQLVAHTSAQAAACSFPPLLLSGLDALLTTLNLAVAMSENAATGHGAITKLQLAVLLAASLWSQ